ncbi:MAG: hypothetical protein NTW87_15685 [Planctomycetota bacterium]|nr:hypothetical protein [Planctomycetota bacterium]
MAQYIAHPARLCEPMPDQISDDVAVLLEPLAIAIHSLDRVAPPPGTGAVVLGAGPIGLTHTLLLARGGISPLIVTDPLEYRLQVARELGATHTLNPRRDNVTEAVMDLLMAFKASAPRRKGLDVLMIRRANRTLGRALARTLHEKLPLSRLATHHWPMEKSAEAFTVAAEYRDGIVKGIINP